MAVSHDLSRSWRLADWKWTMARDRIMAGNFLDGGKDNSAAFDEYVYCYFTRIENLPPGGQPRNWIHERPGRIDLARVPKDGLLNRDAYEWFHGLDGAGAPVWTKDMKARAPAFEDPNGIKVVSACYVRALEKCLLLYNPRDNRGHFALFEAPAPWGPWRRAAYLPDCQPFMPPEENARVSLFHFAPKWWSEDGREFSLVFNTGDDAWNTVRGRLLLR
ncbi:MAG: hypothetical protein BWZ10_02518 [candidate division BRC1 bacterium ADurb.BinA364]|nr:MAG: hypothetical protein BWZ10_02518 [candidate division BRC1 bacterium ADurb.BinA364]